MDSQELESQGVFLQESKPYGEDFLWLPKLLHLCWKHQLWEEETQ